MYGAKSTSEAYTVVYVFPWQLLLVITIVLAIGIFALIQIVKRYNKWIIQQAQSSK